MILDGGTRFGDRFLDLTQDVHTAVVGLCQCFGEHFIGKSFYFDVHLTSRDTVFGTRYLEVHIAQVVFVAQNVRKDGELAGFLVGDKAHGDTRYRFGNLDTGIHQSQRTGAYRSHRGRSVGFQHVGYDAYRVGAVGRDHLLQGPVSQVPVAYFPAGYSAHRLGFTGGIGREVIVKIKVLFVFERYAVHFVGIEARTEGYRAQGLRFAAGEHGRTVRGGQCIHYTPDGAYFGRFTAVQADPFVQDQAAYRVALYVVVVQFSQSDFLCPFFFVHPFFGQVLLDEFTDDLVEFLGAFLLAQPHFGYGIGFVVSSFLNFFAKLFVVGLVAVNAFYGRFRHFGGESLLGFYLVLDSLVGGFKRFDHFLFGNELHLAFHHSDGIHRRTDHQFDVGLFHLLLRGVDDELSVDTRYAHLRNRAVERDIGYRDSGGGGQSGQRIGAGLSVV